MRKDKLENIVSKFDGSYLRLNNDTEREKFIEQHEHVVGLKDSKDYYLFGFADKDKHRAANALEIYKDICEYLKY